METDFNELNELRNQLLKRSLINELTVKTKSNYITLGLCSYDTILFSFKQSTTREKRKAVKVGISSLIE